jgi:hypothetical protein
VHTRFWWRNLREKDHLKDPGEDVRIILKRVFEKWYGRTWTRSIRIGTCGEFLLMH